MKIFQISDLSSKLLYYVLQTDANKTTPQGSTETPEDSEPVWQQQLALRLRPWPGRATAAEVQFSLGIQMPSSSRLSLELEILLRMKGKCMSPTIS
jgi:hypothetical protein